MEGRFSYTRGCQGHVKVMYMTLDIQQHLFSHDSFLYLQMYFCMCMVGGIKVLYAWERSRVYRLGMGEQFTFYVQMI